MAYKYIIDNLGVGSTICQYDHLYIVVFFSLIALCYCSRATPFDYVNVNKLSTLYIRRQSTIDSE